MGKQNVYVSVAHLTCNLQPGSSYEFVLQMDPIKARVFSKLFTQMQSLEAANAFRAHLPYIPYHMDRLNHEIDYRLQKIYALIHEFGDDEAKRFVEQLPYFRAHVY
ncbi:MAG: transposase [Solibacillus sp.]|uniref:transposase n=1 Tax=unclassified Solibacillus TaxID=2637870 RepID=UPI003101A132